MKIEVKVLDFWLDKSFGSKLKFVGTRLQGQGAF